MQISVTQVGNGNVVGIQKSNIGCDSAIQSAVKTRASECRVGPYKVGDIAVLLELSSRELSHVVPRSSIRNA